MKCQFCEQEITDPKSSYGSIYEPLCMKCHFELQEEMSEPVYGLYIGGDPRKFSPDVECSTSEEMALYWAICHEWNSGNQKRNLPHSMIGVNNV